MWNRPHVMERKVWPPDTSTGVFELALLPVPSWPFRPTPAAAAQVQGWLDGLVHVNCMQAVYLQGTCAFSACAAVLPCAHAAEQHPLNFVQHFSPQHHLPTVSPQHQAWPDGSSAHEWDMPEQTDANERPPDTTTGVWDP